MDSQQQPTCGKGLAEHSALPGMLSELVYAVGVVLQEHMKALDLEDMDSKKEYEVYKGLVDQHREIAAKLAETARDMEGYRDLPMGRHDEGVLMSPRAVKVFEDYVSSKRELLAFLKSTVEQDQMMLDQMR
jgi:hypothetical protein